MAETRIPTQKRSIEKRNKIIKMGFDLMCDKGYHNISTTEIAEYAGVSTGIIYQYFNDKKEIFIEGVKNYANDIMFPMLNILETTKIDINNIDKLLLLSELSIDAISFFISLFIGNNQIKININNATNKNCKTTVLIEKLFLVSVYINTPPLKIYVTYTITETLFCQYVFFILKKFF